MTTQMALDTGPITFTEPSSSTRYYYGGNGSDTNIHGTFYIELPYSDPTQGLSTEQPLTYIGYSLNTSGVFSFNQANAIDSWFNAFSPQNIPSQYLESELDTFDGPSSNSDFAEYFETLNNNGTATYYVAVVNASGATPSVTQVDNITTTPIAKTVSGDGTAHLGRPSGGTSLNDEIFEVEGAPTTGQVQGSYIIFNSSGAVLFGPSTGFNFTDGVAHVFNVGTWDSNNFAQLVEVWNQSTGLADLQLSLINATSGTVTTGWAAPTELQSITKINWQFVSPAGGGMIVAADGSDASGRGAFLYDVNDSTASAGGVGGTISESLAIHYSGTVVQDATIRESGTSNEYVVYWIDSNGMTIDLINSSLQVLETYNIAAANAAGDVEVTGNGDLLVTYRVQSSPTSAVDDAVIVKPTPNTAPPSGTSADMIMSGGSGSNIDYEIYDLGNNSILGAALLGFTPPGWQVAGLGGFDGSDTSDMILRNSGTGAFEIYDISNNNITNAAAMGQVGLEWSVAGFGDFSSNSGETDMLMQNSGTGQFEVYDISNNTITFAGPMGQVGLEWRVSGFGDFSGNANETDMLMQNSGTGQFEVYDISNNTITSAGPMGQVGLEWQVAGFGDFSGNANETDMLMQNSGTGQFEVYDISNNTITSAGPMGQVGLEWQVAGFGDFSGNANETNMLMQNSGTGQFEVYDISHNTITSAAGMGQVGREWSVAGIATDPTGVTSQLAQSMASFAPAAGLLPASPQIDTPVAPPSAASPLTSTNVQYGLA